MSVEVFSLCPWLVAVLSFMSLVVLIYGVAESNWARVIGDLDFQRSFLMSVAFLLLIWQVKGYFMEGVTVHFLGLAVVALSIGIAEAIVVGFIATILLQIASGFSTLGTIGVNFFCSVSVPCLVIYFVLKVEKWLNASNFFSFIFVCGFFGGGLTAGAAALVMFSTLWMGGYVDFEAMYSSYLPYAPLLMLPEAFINGMLVTALVVFSPHCLVTIDDHRYGQSG